MSSCRATNAKAASVGGICPECSAPVDVEGAETFRDHAGPCMAKRKRRDLISSFAIRLAADPTYAHASAYHIVERATDLADAVFARVPA